MELSDKEREILETMEANLASDAKFSSSMAAGNQRFGFANAKSVVVGLLCFIVGIIFMIVGIKLTIFLSIFGFGFMIFGGAVAFSDKKQYDANGKAEKEKSPFMKNLEEKWEERLAIERENDQKRQQ